ncbi:Cystathionine beta-lyase/cystathionine gamma-synthase [Sulfitobacter marinus]|uniref:Cystathionine beta-lyase/cystathionine gamma-synthase n=1 Tax=Sulfitobacter marinus TaxID=394264 RepID=A0A1I6UBZ3_9RHOB|nr:PLP-dependent transferase [Sulfitobacter marinus]SFS98962.1 Cystathionine beta-lyase/cystathionine gamma-synthase [Sulfitobacter marinus]
MTHHTYVPDLITPARDTPLAASAPPIFQASSFLFESYAQIEAVFSGRSDQLVYSRGDNPTVSELEALIARLEGTEAARGFSSGMAAICGAVLPFVKPGDRIVAIEHVYSDAYRLFETVLRRFGVETVYVDGTDTDSVIAALPDARMVYLESPTSWTFRLQDLGAIATAAQHHGVISVIDNSWATPIFQNPAALGIDLIVHAASKYLSGHSDTLGGLVTGPSAMIKQIDHEATHLFGGRMSPMDAFLVLRGMRTLELRMRAHMQTGMTLAKVLNANPMVTKVHHPGLLAEHPAGLRGFGGLFAFDLAGGVNVEQFCDALQVIRLGVSWGGPESLIVPGQAACGLAGAANSFQRFNVSPRTIRLAAGLEPADVLLADLTQAIDQAQAIAA